MIDNCDDGFVYEKVPRALLLAACRRASREDEGVEAQLSETTNRPSISVSLHVRAIRSVGIVACQKISALSN